MDVSQSLKDTENSLRDFIAFTLKDSLGDDWITKCGVSSDRIEQWKQRKEIEKKRQDTGTVEERLIYYADFYDLKTILKKNWSDEFSKVFGEWKTMDVYLHTLEKYRDVEAHRRELLPHQKDLVLGISGEIRNNLIRYRSKKETGDDYFPRIESVRDNFGNTWVQGDKISAHTKIILRPGDILDFVVTASDPQGSELKYSIYTADGKLNWEKENNLRILITKKHIGKNSSFQIMIKSSKKYHAYDLFDDLVDFFYDVLPKMKEKL